MNADCSLTLQTMPEQLFGRYKDDKVVAATNTYPCPVGTKWSDIHIKLLDRETLSVWRRGEAPLGVSFVKLGMAKRGKSVPRIGFSFFAASLDRGEKMWPVPAKDTDEYQELVQRKREANNMLKAYFPDIKDGDPIEFVESSKSYEFRFQC